jgi:hypothetical protein
MNKCNKFDAASIYKSFGFDFSLDQQNDAS